MRLGTPPAPRCAALAIGLALGCGATDAAPVVEMWALGREGEVVRELLPGFQRRHPGLRVRVQQIPWSAAHEKLLTAYAGDAMPDVFQLGNTWIAEFVALRAVAPLDERIQASPTLDRDDYFQGIFATNVVEGATFGVPWYVDTRLLFYRRDLLESAGGGAPPRTWSEWLDAMARLRALAGEDRHAILLPTSEWQPPVILALQLGAGLLRDGDRHADFASPPFREAFTWYVDLFRRGLAPRVGEAQVGNLYRDFADGRFAMLVTGPWNLGEMRRRLPASLADAWTTSPMPGPDDGRPGLSLAGGSSLALSRSSRLDDEAWQLVEYLSEPATQAEFARLTGDLPARRSAWPASGLDADPQAAAFREQLERVVPLPRVPEWERIATRIAKAAEAVVRGELSIDDALAALDRDVDAILAKRRWILERRATGRGPA